MPTSQEMLSSKVAENKNLNSFLICLALMLLTVIAFSPVKDCGFINLDDNMYVFENVYIKSGLSWESIKQAFSSKLVEKSANWHPLTWLSLMLDYQIFGLNPLGYHLINLLFHVINTILLFGVFRRMTKSLWPSVFVAALFAIHPLHVESVAWIASRKDVLSAFFWILTMGAYSYYAEHLGARQYALVVLFLALGLMAKPILVTLPFVLLLLDYWPLNRFQEIKPIQEVQKDVFKPITSDKQKKKVKKKHAAKEILEVKKPADPGRKWLMIIPLLREKVPLFALVILSSMITYLAQQKGGAVQSFDAYPLTIRMGNAFISYIAYIGKTIWPDPLAVFYPYPEVLIPWQVLGALLLLVVITLAVIWKSSKYPYLAVGWFWYAGTLVPVIGIVQVGSQAMADRYTYIPLIGLFIIVAWGVQDLLRKWKWIYHKEIFWASAAFCILCFSIITWIQVGYWKDNISLYDHALQVTNKNWLAYNSRAVAHNNHGHLTQAIEDLNKAIEINPRYIDSYSNRGIVHKRLGNYTLAIEDYNRIIKMKPNYSETYFNRGNAYRRLGKYMQAVKDFSKAIEINPKYLEAINNRGNVYTILGNHKQAIEDYGRAIEIKPSFSEAYNNRGNAYAGIGNYKQAIEDYGKAIEIKQGYPEAYNGRGVAYVGIGNYKQAIEDFNSAIEIKPDYANAYINRSIAYDKLGNRNQAINDLKMAAKSGNDTAKNLLRSRGISW